MLKLLEIRLLPEGYGCPLPPHCLTSPVNSATPWEALKRDVTYQLHQLVALGKLSHPQRVAATEALNRLPPRQLSWLTDSDALVVFQVDRPPAMSRLKSFLRGATP